MRLPVIVFTSVIAIAMASFTAATRLTVSSPAFAEGGMIPSKYSCKGAEASPPLHITGIPKNAVSLALIAHDPDAPVKGGFTHWVIWNIDLTGNIPENFKGASQGLNSAKKHGYIGMCPPSGAHHYHFYVYALDARLNLDQDTDKEGLEKAMPGHIVAQGELTGLFKKE